MPIFYPRDYIKALGAKWDSDEKKWYCSTGHKMLIEEFVNIKI